MYHDIDCPVNEFKYNVCVYGNSVYFVVKVFSKTKVCYSVSKRFQKEGWVKQRSISILYALHYAIFCHKRSDQTYCLYDLNKEKEIKFHAMEVNFFKQNGKCNFRFSIYIIQNYGTKGPRIFSNVPHKTSCKTEVLNPTST